MTGVDELLAAARAGDDRAYGELIAPHRVELQAYCYRMLGSSLDAEDALQEALLGAWRGLDRFEGRSSVRTWLYRIATNACLKLIERRPRRVLPIDYGPSADPHGDRLVPVTESVWVEPYPADRLLSDTRDTPESRYEQLESVELAFVAALQHLAPAQRAVLILRDVLGFSGDETAHMLGMTATSVYSSLQRAHRAVAERTPEPSQQAALRALGDDELTAIVARFIDAWQRADIDGLVALLTDDATFSMPPMPEWYTGHRDIAEFLARRPLASSNRWRMIPTRANGQAAIGHYLWDDERAAYLPHSLAVLSLRGDQLCAVVAFFVPEVVFADFGLPEVA